jgi:hypothetical protein
MDRITFVVISIGFILFFGYISSLAPQGSTLDNAGNFSDPSEVSGPDSNASAIDQASQVVQNLVGPYVGLSSSNTFMSILIAIIFGGLAYLLATILKDLVPFT